MTFSWGILIAIVYVVIHVISFLAKEAEKKKRREREIEEAERRRIAMARLEMPTSPSPLDAGPFASAKPTVASTPQIGTMRPDDAAARRKLQLEQLRARASATPAPMRSSMSTPPQQPQRTEPRQTTSQRADSGLIDMERERQTRLQAKAKSDAKAREQAKAKIQAKAIADRQARSMQSRKTSPAVAAGAVSLPETQAELELASAPQVHRPRASVFSRQIRDQQTLRNLFVMKEIFDPPLSLR